ncbi:MAG: hypothetical protein JWO32_2742 [Bacteroidetes bacterium]|nr:hypothetical protein [Bacteroidota bacterium]
MHREIEIAKKIKAQPLGYLQKINLKNIRLQTENSSPSKIFNSLNNIHGKISYTEVEYNFLSQIIIESAIEVHKELGPGLFEPVYEYCLIKVLTKKGLEIKSQLNLPVVFRGEVLDKGFAIDILVSNLVIIELKSVSAVLPVHEAQLVTYLKLSGKRLGLLINFNEQLLKDGLRSKINGSLNHD